MTASTKMATEAQQRRIDDWLYASRFVRAHVTDAHDFEGDRGCPVIVLQGGTTARFGGIRHSDMVGAIVDDAEYDDLNPAAPGFRMAQTIFGGRADAMQGVFLER